VDLNLPGLTPEVVGASLIDQLDASDLIFCSSQSVQDNLGDFATQHGRPRPDSRLLPLEEWDTGAAIVRDAVLSLVEDDGA
jgi:hypothetical protein